MKLNLVPDYVRQRKVNKQIIALMVLLFVVVNAAMVFWMIQTQSRLAELQEEKTTLEAQASQVEQYVQQAQTLIQDAQIKLLKAEFPKQIAKQNLRYPELYSQVAQYTSPRVRYYQLQVSQGNQLQIAAFTKGPKEIGLFLQTMYASPLFSAVNLTTQTPGYATGGAGAAMPGLGFGGGAPAGPTVGGLAGPGGGGAPSFSFGTPSTGAAGSEASPAGLMQFQVVAILKEPITPLQPPAQLGVGGTGGFGGGFGGFGGAMGGFGGGPSMSPGAAPGAPPPGARGGGIGID
jgi:Tfp pilus assembly protein PilN